jgi:flagellar biosynthesis protein FlhB
MSDQKTEQPTQRRRNKAREEGRFAVSREFVASVQFLVVLWMLASFGRQWFDNLRESTRTMLLAAYRAELTPESLVRDAWMVMRADLSGPMIAGAAVLAVTVGMQLFSTGLGLSLKKLSPSVARLNPLSKLKELPRQNVPVLIQSLILLPLFGWAVYALGMENWETFLRFPMTGIESAAQRTFGVLETLLWRAGGLFLVFGLVDLFRQQKRYQKDLRMTKQEIRDEYKESEGNPQIKQRVRRIQRDLARRNMMKEIPNATAVIVNPTHYSVAIRYSLESAGAPLVVAKGKNYLALRIKARAMEHEIPIVENQPLAQALYKSADVGQEIPAHLYRAVAEVLAYIFKLMNGRLPGRG